MILNEYTLLIDDPIFESHVRRAWLEFKPGLSIGLVPT